MTYGKLKTIALEHVSPPRIRERLEVGRLFEKLTILYTKKLFSLQE